MSDCYTCGGFGNRHDPTAHGWEAVEWITCATCRGDRTVRDAHDLDVTCPNCDGSGGWEP